MPMKYIEPVRAGCHKGVFIYHVYKDGMADEPSDHWYTTSVTEDPDFEFDVREIKVPEDQKDLKVKNIDFTDYGSWLLGKEAQLSNHLKIIAYGLNTGQIKVDKEHN